MKAPNKKVTIYQVAHRAGVAISTVSRVLNNSPNVSDKTKEKVKAAIDELNFRPQVSARKLASRQPQMLAIAVPSFTTPFYNEILKGVKDEIQEMDLDIVIYNTGSKNPKEGIENFFDRGTADTVISVSIDIDDNIHRQIQASGIPIVLIGTSHPEYDYFDINHRKGGFLAGEHLVKQGYEKMGLIRPALPTKAGKLREQGFIDALKEFKMPVMEKYFITGDSTKHAGFTEEAGFEAINAFDRMGEFPDAIFCANDTQAIGAYHALNRLGIKVPEDIGLMGYDNIKFTKYLDLTTVDQQMHNIGVKATKRLAELIKDRTSEKVQVTIDPILVPRNSTNNPNK